MLFYACYGLLGANTPAAMRWNMVPEKICFSYAVFSTGVPQVLGVGEHIWVNAEALETTFLRKTSSMSKAHMWSKIRISIP